jgi:hypothetical protein
MNFSHAIFTTRFRYAGLAIVAWVLGTAAARAGDFVVVSAEAIPQYKRAVTSKGSPAPQSYIVTEGRHFGAAVRDTSEEKMAFMDIAKTLAPALAKQAYFPARAGTDPDLLIVIHWGTTHPYDDPSQQFDIERRNAALDDYKAVASGNDGKADPEAINQVLAQQNAGIDIQQRMMDEAAELLGYKRSLRTRSKSIMASEEEKTMVAELNEERYFIALMAYDYGVFKREKRRQLLWTTHMNVRSAGQNFTMALPAMATIAANYFGKDKVEPVHVSPEHRGRVEVGEPTVVEPASDRKR